MDLHDKHVYLQLLLGFVYHRIVAAFPQKLPKSLHCLYTCYTLNIYSKSQMKTILQITLDLSTFSQGFGNIPQLLSERDLFLVLSAVLNSLHPHSNTIHLAKSNYLVSEPCVGEHADAVKVLAFLMLCIIQILSMHSVIRGTGCLLSWLSTQATLDYF